MIPLPLIAGILATSVGTSLNTNKKFDGHSYKIDEHQLYLIKREAEISLDLYKNIDEEQLRLIPRYSDELLEFVTSVLDECRTVQEKFSINLFSSSKKVSFNPLSATKDIELFSKFCILAYISNPFNYTSTKISSIRNLILIHYRETFRLLCKNTEKQIAKLSVEERNEAEKGLSEAKRLVLGKKGNASQQKQSASSVNQTEKNLSLKKTDATEPAKHPDILTLTNLDERTYSFFNEEGIYIYQKDLDENNPPGTFFQEVYLPFLNEKIHKIKSRSEFFGFLYMLYFSDCFNWEGFIETYIKRKKIEFMYERVKNSTLVLGSEEELNNFEKEFRNIWAKKKDEYHQPKWRFLRIHAPKIFDDIFKTHISSMSNVQQPAPSHARNNFINYFYQDKTTENYKNFIYHYNVKIDLEKSYSKSKTNKTTRGNRKSTSSKRILQLDERRISDNTRIEDELIDKIDSNI